MDKGGTKEGKDDSGGAITTTNAPPVVLIMGVTASGKTTFGEALARALHRPYFDADDFHSPQNKTKMQQGIPLTDEDRQPWLDSIGEKVPPHNKSVDFTFQIRSCITSNSPAVLSCSALKKVYRDFLRQHSEADEMIMVYLKVSKDVIRQRIEHRQGHFMNKGLVDSQFDILEEPMEEPGVIVADGEQELYQILEYVQRQLG